MDIPSELWLILTIFLLTLLSGFFSSSETALTVLSKAKIYKLMQKNIKKLYMLVSYAKIKTT